ncbi:MAG: Ig-like domain-containing protein [Gemmatimonadaceae bacterium]|nr:Ig-like domain-containing protein [Gemmatimonadaceae bacterium]
MLPYTPRGDGSDSAVRSVAHRLLLTASLLVVLSCGDSTSSSAPAVDRVVAAPSTLSLSIGETKAVSARALDAAGNPVARRLFWSTSNAAVATVTQGGIVTSVIAGSAEIAVSSGGSSQRIPVTVLAREASQVLVTPPASTILVGASTSLTAAVLDATGAVVEGSTVSWSSSSQAVASVGGTGVVTGVGTGSTTITATVVTASASEVRGSAVIQVQPVPVASITLSPGTATVLAGQSLQLMAQPRDAGGRALTGRTITWSSSAPSAASVSSTGLVIAFAPGATTITVTSEGRSATARVTVTPVPVAAVSIVPAVATVSVRQTAQLVARVTDSTGALLDGRAVSWSSDAPSIATVDGTGVVTAVAAGQARISASAEGRTGAAVVTVTPIPVASLEVAPDSAALLEGDTLQLSARPLDAQGRVLTGRVVSWLSGAPSIATVNASGRVTAIGPGVALIIASSEGVSATVSIAVARAVVVAVQLSAATVTLVEGATQQLTATALDARGRPMAGKVVTWSSSNIAVAAVSASGLVQAISPGSATITASSDGVTGTSAITVRVVPIATVTIAPASANLTTGNTVQLTAQMLDAAGNPISPSGRAVSWSSAAPSIATVGASGVVTGTSAGIVTITGTVEGVTGTASIIVTNAPVSTVQVAPAAPQLTVGTSAQLSATALDAGGNVVTGRPVTWTSSDPAVATVSTSGLVSALAAGSAQLTATVDGVRGTATVTVSQVSVARVQLNPASASLLVGGTVQLSATATDSAGNPLTGRVIAWSSGSAAVATVSSTGLVSAVGAGTTVITATIDGIRATASITVADVPIASISLSPSSASVTAGSSVALAATVTDAKGNVLTGRVLTWTTDNSVVATVSQGGIVAGVSAGGATITVSGASAGQSTPVTTSAKVSVTAPSVKGPASVVIAPLTGSIHVGTRYARQVSAQVFDAAGAPMPNEVVTWSTSDPSRLVATTGAVSTSAVLTASAAPASGMLLIATAGGLSPVADTILVTSDLVPIARVTASPLVVTIPLKSTQTLAATALDSAGNQVGTTGGNPLGGRAAVWTSADTNVVTVDKAGVATGGPQRGVTRIEVVIDGVGPAIVLVIVL